MATPPKSPDEANDSSEETDQDLLRRHEIEIDKRQEHINESDDSFMPAPEPWPNFPEPPTFDSGGNFPEMQIPDPESISPTMPAHSPRENFPEMQVPDPGLSYPEVQPPDHWPDPDKLRGGKTSLKSTDEDSAD
ncbi:hypothetical protein [Burkholderia ubonensis]|uniref:hypothetical protein n=1 Tax=Burkholderia ubonensis TaxID=101571 RepID=UPI0012FB875F|nr:hypothetical protein [Burkholderia ubonensis]